MTEKNKIKQQVKGWLSGYGKAGHFKVKRSGEVVASKAALNNLVFMLLWDIKFKFRKIEESII